MIDVTSLGPGTRRKDGIELGKRQQYITGFGALVMLRWRYIQRPSLSNPSATMYGMGSLQDSCGTFAKTTPLPDQSCPTLLD